MRRHSVVAYPRMSEADAAWVESVRAEHDPQFALIRAHFTLVFPAFVPAEALRSRVASCVSGRRAFEVFLATAAADRDEERSCSYVFLLPSAGGQELVALHEAMYGGELRRHRRSDRPYTPHLTVANKAEHASCVALANELNRRGISLHAEIHSVDIIVLDAGGMTSSETMPFRA